MAPTTFAVSIESTSVLHFDVDAVDLVLQVAVVVLEAAHHGVQRSDHQVVPVDHFDAFDVGVAAGLLRQHADHLQPGVVDLDVLADGGIVSEQVHFGRFAEHADRGGAAILFVVEEAAFHHLQAVDRQIVGRDADEQRRFLRGLRQHLQRLEPLARRERFDARRRSPRSRG